VSGDVLPFKPRAPTVDEVTVSLWTCHCGGDKWQMLNGGIFRCAECRCQCSFRWWDPREPPPVPA